MYRLARLLQAPDGEASGLPDQLPSAFRVVSLLQDCVGRTELNGESAEGMGQNIMELAAKAVAFRERSRLVPFGVGTHTLGEELFGLISPRQVLTTACSRHEPCDCRKCALGDDLARRGGAKGQHRDGHRSHTERAHCGSWCRVERNAGAERPDRHEGDREGRIPAEGPARNGQHGQAPPGGRRWGLETAASHPPHPAQRGGHCEQRHREARPRSATLNLVGDAPQHSGEGAQPGDGEHPARPAAPGQSESVWQLHARHDRARASAGLVGLERTRLRPPPGCGGGPHGGSRRRSVGS